MRLLALLLLMLATLAGCSTPERVQPQGRTFVDTTETAPIAPK